MTFPNCGQFPHISLTAVAILTLPGFQTTSGHSQIKWKMQKSNKQVLPVKCRRTSTEHVLVAVTAVVVALTVLAAVALWRVISSEWHRVALTLATHTLAPPSTRQTVVRPCNRHSHITHTSLTALCPGLTGWASTKEVKPIWILLKQETVSGISWAVCKSVPCSRQITMPGPNDSVFYRPDALPAAQPCQSTEGLSWRTHLPKHSHSRTHTHPFNGPLSGTTRVSQYQKRKTNLDFTEARDSDWHQLGHMQVCTLLQTDNHARTQPVSFLQAACSSCRPTNSVKALKAWVGEFICPNTHTQWNINLKSRVIWARMYASIHTHAGPPHGCHSF